MFAKDLYDFIVLLNKHKAEYLVVGGYAVGNYGYPRATGDLDVWLNPVKENYVKIKSAVTEFGFPPSAFLTEKEFLSATLFRMGNPPLRIEILTDISGVTFANAYKNKVEKTIEGLNICYIGFDDLIKNKIASGRPKDILDVKYFENINKGKKRK